MMISISVFFYDDDDDDDEDDTNDVKYNGVLLNINLRLSRSPVTCDLFRSFCVCF